MRNGDGTIQSNWTTDVPQMVDWWRNTEMRRGHRPHITHHPLSVKEVALCHLPSH